LRGGAPTVAAYCPKATGSHTRTRTTFNYL
jgi:hypothetical protein